MSTVRPRRADRDALLVAAVRTVLRDLDAVAVALLVRVAHEPFLGAVVAAVTPLGVGTVERVPVDDETFASSRAYRTGQPATAHSLDVLVGHPELSAFAPFPSTAAAAPLSVGGERHGCLIAFWQRPYGEPEPAEVHRLARAAAAIGEDLEGVDDVGAVLTAPRVPLVVAAEPSHDGDGSAAAAAPFFYHLHKLAIRLVSATDTRSVVEPTMNRLLDGFRARAAVVTLLAGRSLQVVAESGCSPEFLRTLDGQPVRRGTPEGDALHGRQQHLFPPGDPRVDGRVAPPADCGDGGGAVWIVIPLLAGRRSVGTCSIAFTTGHGKPVAEWSALSALSTLLGQAFERTRMLDAQHTLADTLQRTLLPGTLSLPAGLAGASRYLSATNGIEIGGDWYDVIRLPGGRVALIVGDVEGHNISAAVVMGQLRSAMRAYAAEGHGPGALLARTHHLLVGLGADLFATCCCLLLDPADGSVRTASAGHPPPLVRGPGGPSTEAEVQTGPPLGVETDPSYPVRELRMAPGTLLALYTDGLTERFGPGSPADALEEAVAPGGGLEEVCDRLTTGPDGAPAPHRDDAALLLVRYDGPPGADPGA